MQTQKVKKKSNRKKDYMRDLNLQQTDSDEETGVKTAKVLVNHRGATQSQDTFTL